MCILDVSITHLFVESFRNCFVASAVNSGSLYPAQKFYLSINGLFHTKTSGVVQDIPL